MLIIDPKTLKLQIDNYFDQVEEKGCFYIGEVRYAQKEPAITGLALFLGFSGKGHFRTYAENPEYESVMNYALLRLENFYEQLNIKGIANAKVGLKFFKGWEDMPQTNNNFTLAQFMKDEYENEEMESERRMAD